MKHKDTLRQLAAVLLLCAAVFGAHRLHMHTQQVTARIAYKAAATRETHDTRRVGRRPPARPSASITLYRRMANDTAVSRYPRQRYTAAVRHSAAGQEDVLQNL